MAAMDREFIEAVEDGRRDDVIALLRNGTCVNSCKQETQDSALMIACEKGHMDIVKLLFEHKVEIATCNSTGECAVHSTVLRDNIEAIDELFKNGADLNSVDMYGITPLHLAVNKGFIRSTKRLLRYGANANICESGFHRSPLHDAVRNRDFRTAQMLLENDAFVDEQDVSGATPLHEAVTDNNLHMARLLLKYGADITIRENIGGLTPFKAARSREMRHLLTLFAQRGRRDSSRSSDVDSGTHSLHGSHDNILADSLQSSRESLFSLPAIKLNENLPYDADTERRLINRIRSRSVEKPVLVEFSGSKARKARSAERGLNHIDVMDKTQYITRGRLHRPRKRVPVTPHRSHSLESVYDVKKGSLRGHRFSWSPIRRRSRSNSYEKYGPPRQYTEPPLKPYESKFRRDFLHNTDYMHVEPLEIDVRVVVNPKNGASKDTDYHSDGESGVSSVPSELQSQTDKRKQYSAQTKRAGSAYRMHNDFSTSKAVPNQPVTNEYVTTGQGSNDHDLPDVHGSSPRGGAGAARLSDHDTSDDDILDTYEEELHTKKRPVHIYSSIEDLSIVAADGKGITLKEDEEEAARKKRVSRIIEHKITRMNKHQILRGHRKGSEDTLRESDRSELSGDGHYDNSPLYSPILRHSSQVSPESSENFDSQRSSTPRTRNDGNFVLKPSPQTTHSPEICLENKRSYTVFPSNNEDIGKPTPPQWSAPASPGIMVTEKHTESDIPEVHGAAGQQPTVVLRNKTKVKSSSHDPDEEAVDTSSYMQNISEIRKSFEVAGNKFLPKTGNITDTLRVVNLITSENYEAVDPPSPFENNSQSDRESNTGQPPILVKQESFEIPETQSENGDTETPMRKQHVAPDQKPKAESENQNMHKSVLVQDVVQNYVVDVQSENGNIHDSGPVHHPPPYKESQIETESELSQDEYASLHSSIRDQMYLQSQGAPETTRRKRGSLTPVGSVIRKELDIGRSDSELEEDFRDRVQDGDLAFTHYDAKEPLKTNKMKSSVRTSEIQTTPRDSDQDDVSSEAETLTSGDANDNEQETVAIDTKSSDEEPQFTEEIVTQTKSGAPQNLRDVMQGRAGASYQLGMAPMGEPSHKNHTYTKAQKAPKSKQQPPKFDTDTTESELSDYERDSMQNITTDEEPLADHTPRMSGASSPEPEWDRTYTYDDDALLTGQSRKLSRKSSKSKSKSTKKQTSKSTGTETEILKSDQVQVTEVGTQHMNAGYEPEIVPQETDSLSASAQTDIQSGNKTDKLATSSYGAFDMYEKPPEKVSQSSESKETSFWGRVCGCCYNFGLY